MKNVLHYDEILGRLLRAVREGNELTLEEAADGVGCAVETLRAVEVGLRKRVSLELLVDACEFYRVSLPGLLTASMGGSA